MIDLSGGVKDSSKTIDQKMSVPERMARIIATHPWKMLIASLVFATILSYIGLVVGDFSVEVDNKGWRSRGTVIGDREMQTDVLRLNRESLFNDKDGSAWEDLENNIQTGWVVDTEEENDDFARRLQEVPSFLEGCDPTFYYSPEMLFRDNMYAMWKTEPEEETTYVSTLDAKILKQICEADTKTLAALEANNACKVECGGNKCLPGHSLSLVLHVYLGLEELSCDALVEAYTTEVQEEFTSKLADCSNEIRDSFDPVTRTWENDESCPELFRSSLLSSDFGLDGNLVNRYSTTYFNTADTRSEAYEAHDDFGFGDGVSLQGAYGTLWDFFSDSYVDSLLTRDMVSHTYR